MRSLAFAFGVIAAALAACRDRAPDAARPPVVAAESTASGAVDAATAASEATPFVAEKVTGEAHAMGTHLAFAAFTTPALDAARIRSAFDAAIAEIVRLETLMTTWDPDSEVSRVNAAAGKARRPRRTGDVRRDPRGSARERDLRGHVRHHVRDACTASGSSTRTSTRIRRPTPQVKRASSSSSATATCTLDPARARVYPRRGARPRSASAASPRATPSTARRGCSSTAGLTSFFVQAGGDLYAHGKQARRHRRGRRHPRSARPRGRLLRDARRERPRLQHRRRLRARATSSDGKRYHHIIDPRTGYPATASRSVTIWAPTALIADEIDDAVFILGPEKGLALVESIDGVGAVIVDAQNKVWTQQAPRGASSPGASARRRALDQCRALREPT